MLLVKAIEHSKEQTELFVERQIRCGVLRPPLFLSWELEFFWNGRP